jgi:calcium-dependent protein kinase
MLQAIYYTHKNGICHRDLKPENFLFNSEKRMTIKMIDFGLSTSYLEEIEGQDGKTKKKLTKLKTCAGTSLYMAPEVIQKKYSFACDLWSLGVILYVMIGGYPPFYGDNDIEVFESVINMDYNFDDEVWESVSAEAKDLITNLLQPYKKRISCKDALRHPFILKHAGEVQ